MPKKSLSLEGCSREVCAQLENAALRPQVMIDCSHANSRKTHANQKVVCRDVIEQIKGGERRIIGVMMESNLVAGAQKLTPGKPIVYGRALRTPASDGMKLWNWFEHSPVRRGNRPYST